jgi:acetoin utilization deacetylase AcuC-like enzyme
MSKTAVIWDERYLKHITGPWHPERPERLAAIQKVLKESPVAKKLNGLQPRFATLEEIALIHDFEYVKRIEKVAGLDVELDPDTHLSPGSWDAARLAVGGCWPALIGSMM